MEINLDNPKSIFPRDVYKRDEGNIKNVLTLKVKDQKELDAARSDGWQDSYIHQDFPKIVYHADGRTLKVVDKSEEEEAKKKGFSNTPVPEVHVDPETRAHQRAMQQDAILAEKQLATDRALLELLRGKVDGGAKPARG